MPCDDLEKAMQDDPFLKLGHIIRNDLVVVLHNLKGATDRLNTCIENLQDQIDDARSTAHKGPLMDPAGSYQVREDGAGSGWFGASRVRSDGSRYPHRGLDTVVEPGQPVYAPAAGTIERFGACYSTQPYMGLIALDIGGEFLIKILYVEPKASRFQTVKRGDVIGHAQDITGRKNYRALGMTPHIHTEVWHDGKPINPARLMGIKKEAVV